MTAMPMSPFEAILRLCETAAPNPWYPRDHCEQNGIARASIDPLLDQLRMSGLIELTDWVDGHGQGYRLTMPGRSLLADPRSLARLARGELPAPQGASDDPPNDERQPWTLRARLVKEAILSSDRAVVALILGIANVLVFVWGYSLASAAGVGQQYLSGSGNITQILDRLGAVRLTEVLQGDWWRLATACFVHIGIMHIAVNSYALFVLGPITERMYGHWRFLLLYLVSGVGGSALGVYLDPRMMAGASGAICGLLGALASWTVLNSKYLPPAVRSSWLRSIVINIVLISVVSFFPGVSWAGHLGGGITGLVVGILLTLNRFGTNNLKWLALVLVLALGWALLFGLQFLQHSAPLSEDEEIAQFEELLNKRVAPRLKKADVSVEGSGALELPGKEPRPSKDSIQAGIDSLQLALIALREAQDDIDHSGPFKSETVRHARQALLDRVTARIALFDLCEGALKRPDRWTDEDRADLDRRAKRVNESDTAWKKLVK
jgi:membrane associated rhomboid family serine protease